MDVVVTGMACLCAAGTNPHAALRGLENARKHLTSSQHLDKQALPYPFFPIGEALFPGRRRHSAWDTYCLAHEVVTQALSMAQLPLWAQREASVVFGTTAGSALHFLASYRANRTLTANADTSGTVKECNDATAGGDIEDYFSSNLALQLVPDACGQRLTITDACTSGADAVGIAADLIATGQCFCAICGGADALSLVPHTGFARLMISSDTPCRPFDRNRNGLNLGEGAAALVLEDAAFAKRRNAPVLGRILGFGSASDAYHITAPHPEGRGLRDAIALALAQAAISQEDIAFVNAHGTATRENDRVEGQVLHALLPHTPVWGSKGGTGHTLGAAGALEAVLALAALHSGFVPATQGFVTPDPEIGFAPTREVQPVTRPYALSTSLGFGGGNAALVLGLAR